MPNINKEGRKKRVNNNDVEPYSNLMRDGIKVGIKVEHLDWVWQWYKDNFYLDGRFKTLLKAKQVVINKRRNNI